MKVTEKDVAYVADLANLELTAEESARMVVDLNSILAHMDKLNQLNTGAVEPSAVVVPAAAGERFTYAWREDEPRPGLERESALANAPDTDGSCFRVPKVIER
jgi:aspartyl-tRNA(Asn)/glutamyl-tRNA(Gln) amidotransferase subunit C